METESRVGAFFTKTGEILQEQIWFQQLKAKWDELDARVKTYVQFGMASFVVLIVIGGAVAMLAGARSLRTELADKTEVLNQLRTASEEMAELRRINGDSETGSASDWPAYFTTAAGTAGVKAESLTISPEKPGSGMDASKESLFDIELKEINVRQLTRYAYSLENGGKPVKLRALSIDTKEDLSGYVSATLSVSTFAAKDQ